MLLLLFNYHDLAMQTNVFQEFCCTSMCINSYLVTRQLVMDMYVIIHMSYDITIYICIPKILLCVLVQAMDTGLVFSLNLNVMCVLVCILNFLK